jgi:hypothetical protein
MDAASRIYDMAEAVTKRLLEETKSADQEQQLNFQEEGAFSAKHEAFRSRNPMLCGALATDAVLEMGLM